MKNVLVLFVVLYASLSLVHGACVQTQTYDLHAPNFVYSAQGLTLAGYTKFPSGNRYLDEYAVVSLASSTPAQPINSTHAPSTPPEITIIAAE